MNQSTDGTPAGGPPRRRAIRWWPAIFIALAAGGVIAGIRMQEASPFQERNLRTLATLAGTLVLLLLWWILLSRAHARLRVAVTLLALGIFALGAACFRIRGVSGDLIPLLEFRWRARATTSSPALPPPSRPPNTATNATAFAPPGPEPVDRADFPQFLGPRRDGVLNDVTLDPDWTRHPPEVLWRQPVGPGWSGFAIRGRFAVTQEQQGEDERVRARDLETGALLWEHSDRARYATVIAGEGPRATPTIAGDRVLTLGATGRLNCLRLSDGTARWTRDLLADAAASVPEWGFAGSPLVIHGLVIVSAGGEKDHSTIAYRIEDGTLAWHAGTAPAGYGSPAAVTLAGREQLLLFNSRKITAHDPRSGEVLWEYPWGKGFPHVAMPVVVGPDRVLFSSGYGVGSELLEIREAGRARLEVSSVWHSLKMKAKFSNPHVRDGYLYGLDDGQWACIAVADGTQRWKQGRYGHGQGLLLGEHVVLMAESGELILLRSNPEGPGELHRFPVFSSKTWNPVALAGDRLLVRNDQEAAAVRLRLSRGKP